MTQSQHRGCDAPGPPRPFFWKIPEMGMHRTLPRTGNTPGEGLLSQPRRAPQLGGGRLRDPRAPSNTALLCARAQEEPPALRETR